MNVTNCTQKSVIFQLSAIRCCIIILLPQDPKEQLQGQYTNIGENTLKTNQNIKHKP